MTFHVGQKVVCINAVPWKLGCWDDPIPLREGEIYTVRRCFTDEDGDEILWLDEISRSESARRRWGPDVGYGAFRFRPVIERKTDISVFQKMLTPTDKVSEKPRVLPSSAP